MNEILVVDDNPLTLRLLQVLLAEESYKLRLANNGSTALLSIQSNQPDLILLDVNIPGMTGYEVCQRLKENPATREVPIIFVSGAQKVLDKVKAFSMGAVDYVTKPFQAEELKSRIRTHLKIRELQQDLSQFNQRLENQVKERTATLEFTNQELTREIQVRRETEERFHLLVEGTKDYAILFINPEGMVISWNEGARRITGYEAEEIVGHHFSCFYTKAERDAGKPAEELQRTLVQGMVQDEGWRIRKDGSRFWASVVVTALYGEQGRHRGFSMVTRDISERKQAEEALRTSQEEMQALLAGTASVTGPEFFPVLVQHLAKVLHVKYALVTELLEEDKEKTHCLSIRMGDQWGPGFIYSLHDTPCGETIRNGEAYYPDNVQALFPHDQDLIDLGAVSYKGIRLENREGKAIGHLAVLDDKPFNDSLRTQSLFRLFAGRAGAELERKMAEAALQGSEAYYRSIFANALYGIAITGPDFKFEKVNDAWCQLIGYTEDELLDNMGIADVTLPDNLQESMDMMNKLISREVQEGRLEKRYQTKSGAIVHAMTFVKGIYDEQGRYLGNAASILDITDRKRAEEKLNYIAKGVSATTSEQFFRSLVQHLSLVLEVDFALIAEIVPDRPGWMRTISFWGDGQLVKNVEYAIAGTPCESIIGGGLRSYPTEVQTLYPQDRLLGDLGLEGYVGAPLIDSLGICMGLVAVCHRRPLTNLQSIEATLTIFAARAVAELERKQAEEQLQDAYRGLVDLTRRLESAKEEERTRIARELHDEFGQALSSLKWDLACLRREIQSQDGLNNTKTLQARIRSMSDLLLQTINATRRIATSLRPPLLDDLGLIPALEWQVRDFQDRTGISCMLSIDPNMVGEPVTPEQTTALFRMTQELFTNILRHAQASQVQISFRKKDGLLRLEVQDNGIGLRTRPHSSTGSLGLLGVQERAKALGGHFTIRGDPGNGTIAIALIPTDVESLPLDESEVR